jgi:hypothetical protein
MKISSPTTRVKLPVAKLFEMASDGRNFVHYVTDQVKKVNATEDSCSFTIENIAQITLKILEKTPFSHIRFGAENDKNIPLFIDLNFTLISDNESDIEVNLDIDLPIFLQPILQNPLKRFVDTLSEKIKDNVEKQGL